MDQADLDDDHHQDRKPDRIVTELRHQWQEHRHRDENHADPLEEAAHHDIGDHDQTHDHRRRQIVGRRRLRQQNRKLGLYDEGRKQVGPDDDHEQQAAGGDRRFDRSVERLPVQPAPQRA